jgi:hypothetical protein
MHGILFQKGLSQKMEPLVYNGDQNFAEPFKIADPTFTEQQRFGLNFCAEGVQIVGLGYLGEREHCGCSDGGICVAIGFSSDMHGHRNEYKKAAPAKGNDGKQYLRDGIGFQRKSEVDKCRTSVP